MIDKTCLSYWLPLIQRAGVPVPRTEIVRTNCDLIGLLDGKVVDGFEIFISDLRAAAIRIGTPCFLRTGHTSGKHDWDRTCHVRDAGTIKQNVAQLVEFSSMADMMGLPTQVWAVREMLPTIKRFKAFRGMPICREFRFFVDGGRVLCVHPYWPKKALEQGFPYVKDDPETPVDELLQREPQRALPDNWENVYADLCSLPAEEMFVVTSLARQTGAALGIKWSIDVIETERGWFVTDCAEAARSFHWEGCPAK